MAERWRQLARRLTRRTQYPYRQPGRRRHRAPRHQAPPVQFIEIGGAQTEDAVGGGDRLCGAVQAVMTELGRASRHASSAVAHRLIELAHEPGDVLVNLPPSGRRQHASGRFRYCPRNMAVSRGPTVRCRTPIVPTSRLFRHDGRPGRSATVFAGARSEQSGSSADAAAHRASVNGRAHDPAERDCVQPLNLLLIGFLGCPRRERPIDRATAARRYPAAGGTTRSP
jgi:hypothetical protein